MRNLKKLLAVIMVVAMIASIMVPALAEEGFNYEKEAEQLRDLGLFKGTNNGLELEAELTREQALTLMIRIMGLEDEVAAMTEEEVATYMARVVDPETVTETWARPYVAYAVKNGLTKGIDGNIWPNVKFAGQLKVTGKEFINFMLYGMGYKDVAWDSVLDKAAEVGMLSAGEAVKFGTINALTRDNAVGIMSKALKGTTSEGITLAEYLVNKGAVDKDKMVEYGYYTPTPTPTEAPVVFAAEATVNNLAQVSVTFNRDVDKDSAEDVGNYKIKNIKIADAALQDDGRTVVLTLNFADVEKKIEQGFATDLTINGVKDLDGEVLKDYTIEDVVFTDDEIPYAVDAAVVGKSTIKVVFSEPVKGDYDNDNKIYTLPKSNFSVNNGKSYIKQVKLQKNNTEALIQLYNSLKEGEITLAVKADTKDYAGYAVKYTTFTLEVVEDKEAPVVIAYEKATRSEVTLIWSEDVEANGKLDPTKFYHTNSKNIVREENLAKEQYSVKFDGNKTTLYFDDDYLLPNGTAYVYVAKDAVKDLWDNKNELQVIKVEIEVDETAPEVVGIDVEDENKIVIKFNEELDEDTAEDEDNYTLLDNKGKEKANIIDDIVYTSKKVTITFNDDLNGDYTIVLTNIKDKSGNKMEKTAIDFNVGDITPPNPAKFTATLYRAGQKDQMLRVYFDDVMATDGKYSVTDVEKYAIYDSDEETLLVRLEEIDDVVIEITEDGKAVEIYVPSWKDVDFDDEAEEGVDYFDLEEGMYVQIGRVADAAENKMEVISTLVEIKASNAIGIDSVEATATDTIKITFKDVVEDFYPEDLKIEVNKVVNNTVIETVYLTNKHFAGVTTSINDDGNTVATITIDEDYADSINNDLRKTPVTVHVVGSKSENRYGMKLERTAESAVDKIKPQVYDDGNDDEDYAATTRRYSKDRKDEKNRYVGDYFALDRKDSFTVRDDVYWFKGSLYLNEEVRCATTNNILLGADFVVKLDGKKLVNGQDYFVEIGEKDEDNGIYELVFYFKGKEVKKNDKLVGYNFDGDLEIELSSDASYIVDMSSKKNKIEAFDKIKLKNIEFYVSVESVE